MNQTEQIIYLYSGVSESSKQAKPLIEKLMQVTKIPIKTLNIDSKQIREMINKSKQVKLTRVPALIISSKSKNKVEVYEGNAFESTVTQLINAFTLALQNEQKAQQMQQMKIQQQKSAPQGLRKTSLGDIFTETDNAEMMATTNGKKKYGKTKLNMPDDVSPFAEDGRMMLGTLERPVEGEGHSEMGHSSISRFGMTKDSWNPADSNDEMMEQQQREVRFEGVSSLDDSEYDEEEIINTVKQTPLKPAIKKVPVKVGKKVEMLEDLDSIFSSNSNAEDGENYGIEKTDGDIEQYRGEPTKRDDKTMGMESIRKQAEQMMLARQTDVESGPRRR